MLQHRERSNKINNNTNNNNILICHNIERDFCSLGANINNCNTFYCCFWVAFSQSFLCIFCLQIFHLLILRISVLSIVSSSGFVFVLDSTGTNFEQVSLSAHLTDEQNSLYFITILISMLCQSHDSLNIEVVPNRDQVKIPETFLEYVNFYDKQIKDCCNYLL